MVSFFTTVSFWRISVSVIIIHLEAVAL